MILKKWVTRPRNFLDDVILYVKKIQKINIRKNQQLDNDCTDNFFDIRFCNL